MFKMKKVNEKNDLVTSPPKKEPRKKQNIQLEQIADKLSIMNDIDSMIQ